ncbi:MAG: hypothetical protein Q9192_007492, partial [Flavoplaca navasiana]
LPSPDVRPKKAPGLTGEPNRLPKPARGPPKKASLLGLPAELRIKIWKNCLTPEGTVNLSRLVPLDRRAVWQCGDRQRFDPSVLSINRQIYEEASEILYHRNFIVEVNCGPNPYDVGTIRYSKWRGGELPRHFPFHRARHITVCIDAHVRCDPDHVFHHMVSLCGLLFVDTKSIKSLCVEVWAGDANGRCIRSDCRSWEEAGSTGFADRFGVDPHPDREDDYEEPSTKSVDDSIFFLLQPLALGKHVEKADVVFCSEYKPSENLRFTLDHFKALVRGEIRTDRHDTTWLRQEYLSIISKRKQCAQQIRQQRAQHHKEWLQRTLKDNYCPHPGIGKTYQRDGGCKKAYCEGCDRWKDFLLRCWKCDMSVCKDCKEDLKKKQSAAEMETKRLRAPGKEKRDRDNQYLLQIGR